MTGSRSNSYATPKPSTVLLERNSAISKLIERARLVYNSIDISVFPSELHYVNLNGFALSLITGETKIEIQYLKLPPWLPPLDDINLEGPFLSEEHLETSCIIHSRITLRSPKQASAIVLVEIERRYPAAFKQYFSKDFSELLPAILEHSVLGNQPKMNILTGIHLSHSGLKLKSDYQRIGSPVYSVALRRQKWMHCY